MTTAREQSEIAAYLVDRWGDEETRLLIVHAVCNVWQPLLQNVLDEVLPLCLEHGKGWEAVRQAREALG